MEAALTKEFAVSSTESSNKIISHVISNLIKTWHLGIHTPSIIHSIFAISIIVQLVFLQTHSEGSSVAFRPHVLSIYL